MSFMPCDFLEDTPSRICLLNNTELPQLGNQVIHPYSDFLLHDMGVELGMIIPVAWPTVMNGGLPRYGDWDYKRS